MEENKQKKSKAKENIIGIAVFIFVEFCLLTVLKTFFDSQTTYDLFGMINGIVGIGGAIVWMIVGHIVQRRKNKRDLKRMMEEEE